MVCEFQKLIYPREGSPSDTGGYMVAVYTPCERVLDLAGNVLKQIKAVGYCLPVSSEIRYDIKGHWAKDAKHGLQFEVENYEEIVIPTREGIIAYLSSGQIRGIGRVLAERIYEAFGDKTLDILDQAPEKLLAIQGISQNKLKAVRDSYLANRGARDVIAFLVPHGITPNRAVKLYHEYGSRTMEIVREHPYRLCELAGIGFATADQIAMRMGFDRLSTERVDQALLYTLIEAEGKGNLCMEKHAFIRACRKLLNTEELSEEMLANRAARLLHTGLLMDYLGNVYRSCTAQAEIRLAEAVIRQKLSFHETTDFTDLDTDLDEEEQHLCIRMTEEQRSAVRMALTNGLSIITGGPGTGKTLIQKAILDLYVKHHPGAQICCCAPTGRAARRMEQSTGYPASTVHKALGLVAREDGSYGEPGELAANLVLVDETSMLDVYLAEKLFAAIQSGTQLVLVGDADQLPSVGPGAVLSELIASGCIPSVRLDKVFRQSSGSRIAANAKLIRHGTLGLEYGDDFQFVESPVLAESAEKIISLYIGETGRCGVDNVALLSPYRQKTETGVNALNARLREVINPPAAGKAETPDGMKKFRVGDKVMQIRNHEDVSNGDLGYIRQIQYDDGDCIVRVDFGDGRVKEYNAGAGDLDMLELGYALTVHKSQGAEYSTVIVNLQCAHAVMLTRPLIYTAITRGKNRVILVGERRALCIAIKRADTEKRGTCLAARLQEKRRMKNEAD